MRDDQVVARSTRQPLARVGMVHGYAMPMNAGIAQECAQHRLACIDDFDADVRILLEQARRKAAVPIPEHERGAAVAEFIEE